MKVIGILVQLSLFLLSSRCSGNLIISEVVDATLSGGLPKFVELTNCGTTAINLSPYSLRNYNNGGMSVTSSLALTGNLPAGQSYVMSYESGLGTSTFQTVYGFGADAIQTGTGFNGDDAIALVLTSTSTVVDVYGVIGVDGTGQPWDYEDSYSVRRTGVVAPSATFTASEWTIPGINALEGADDTAETALIRQRTTPKSHVCNTVVGGDPSARPSSSPSISARPSAMPMTAPPTTTIMEIQGSGLTSSLVGQTVTGVVGIVTAVDSNLFYLQDPTGDNNDATSDALVVFTSSAPTVTVGDRVSVSGTVSEFTPGGATTRNLSTTQISTPTVTIVSSGNALPAPIQIGGTSGRIPPTASMADGVTFFESMRVTLVAPEVIAGTNSFGEIFAVVNGGTGATGLSTRGTLNIASGDFNPERVQIDTDSTVSGSISTPNVLPGEALTDVTGVMGYNFGNFEVIPTQTFAVATSSALTPTTTTLSGDGTHVLVGTYNVLNLDVNESDGDTDVGDGRFDANARIIAVNMNGPDVVALQEIQDNSGSTNNGVVSASATLAALVAAITAVNPSLNYQYIDNTFIGNNSNGGQPGANIRTAFLYNPTRVSVDMTSLNTVVDPTDQKTNEANPFYNSRLPLAATFTFLPTGYKFEVVNNHWSSKGGSAPVMGTAQPFEALQEDVTVNGSLDQRKAQSAAIKTYVTGKDNVIVVGDLNEFEFVSPVNDLRTVMTILTETIPEKERYSYIFQGNSQSLDHILVSSGMVASAEYVHVNAEFVETNTRASDHDPMVASVFADVASAMPSSKPSLKPSTKPSLKPSSNPSMKPSSNPSMKPSSNPSMKPSSKPSGMPSRKPSSMPSKPSGMPSRTPSSMPSRMPSRKPSSKPSRMPSRKPSSKPSRMPSRKPVGGPSNSCANLSFWSFILCLIRKLFNVL